MTALVRHIERIAAETNYEPKYTRFTLELSPRQRQYLAALVRHGSARKAARALGLNSSTVSSGVRRSMWKIRTRLRLARARARP
jgi:DNA-binding CsgD family transcriptional regulator